MIRRLAIAAPRSSNWPIEASDSSSGTPLTRRAFIALAAWKGASIAHAAPLNPGRFKPFADGGRLDLEIAHVLNVLDSYPSGTWSKDSAQFAFDRLNDGILIGLTMGATALLKLGPHLGLADQPRLLSAIADVAGPGFDGMTVSVGTAGSLTGYAVFKDSFVLGGTDPGEGREQFALRLVHELNHVRNLEQNHFRKRSVPAAALFVNFPLATNPTMGMPGVAAFADFVSELAAAHISYRCVKEWHNRWRGERIPFTVNPLALYAFGIKQLKARPPNPYTVAMSVVPDPVTGAVPFNQQVALWMRAMRSVLFHSSSTLNADVGTLFESAFLAAQDFHFRPPTVAPDGGINAE